MFMTWQGSWAGGRRYIWQPVTFLEGALSLGWLEQWVYLETSPGSTPGDLLWEHTWGLPLGAQLETSLGAQLGTSPGSTLRATRTLSKFDLEGGFGLKVAKDEELKTMARSHTWQGHCTDLPLLCLVHVDFRPSQPVVSTIKVSTTTIWWLSLNQNLGEPREITGFPNAE